jgi:nitrite reductase/ring-hydroxylating ferredoxin subunit
MNDSGGFVRAAGVEKLRHEGRLVVTVNGRSILLVWDGGKVHAVDNRCPHMGFPLHKGSLRDGILTCHWHHARFDLESGGTFDLWADDVRSFPAEVRGEEVWIDASERRDERTHRLRRLEEGVEYNLSLVIAKACIGLVRDGSDPVEPFRVGAGFGTRYRQAWGQGLTMHACCMNLLPHLEAEDRPRALYHGLSAVARDSFRASPRFPVAPLPDRNADLPALKRWFRRFVEVRDADGAERCLASAVEAGADDRELAGMLFAAATDHRYLDVGHVADFTNKALESLDALGWGPERGQVLASLVPSYASAARMEESNSWRHPVDLVDILGETFERLPEALATPAPEAARRGSRGDLVGIILGEDPKESAGAMLAALREGLPPVELAELVAYAAALRIAQFPVSNEFTDWDTALHTFSFANAVHQAVRRAPSADVLRGVFDAAMSVYLDRFLNVPPTRLPDPEPVDAPEDLLRELPALLDQRHQVNTAGRLVASYLASGGDSAALLGVIGRLLLREDRDFHSIQTVEAAFRQFERSRKEPEGAHVLVAAIRYLAAHSPTPRAQGQTFEIARRLHRGERLYEE